MRDVLDTGAVLRWKLSGAAGLEGVGMCPNWARCCVGDSELRSVLSSDLATTEVKTYSMFSSLSKSSPAFTSET